MLVAESRMVMGKAHVFHVGSLSQKVNVYREKYAVLAKFYPINDKNKGDARLFADIVDKNDLDA